MMMPYYLWRRRRGKELAGWRERLGLLPSSFRQDTRGAVWIHAVSVGETHSIAGLVKELQHRHPGRRIFLSSVTAAGREAGEKKLPGIAGQFYLPLDWAWAVRRTLEQIRPSVLLIVETELWPNLLKSAKEFGCRTLLINARVSDRSFPGYRLIRPFMRRVLKNITRICAQTATDAERFQALGALSERVIVTGSLKFDGRPPEFGSFGKEMRNILLRTNRSPVFVAGSTMREEEALVLQAWRKIHENHPHAFMILAPRHPDRFEEVEKLLRARQLSYVRRTSLPEDTQEMDRRIASTEILLLDTIGELAEIFGVADFVFIGGSLVPTGGHNIVEPASWGKPVVFGPHMNNFRDVASLFLRAGAAAQVADVNDLGETALRLLNHPRDAQLMGEKAKVVVNEQTGATLRILIQMEEWLGTPHVTAARMY